MAEYLIQDTTLTAIADAIREKTGDEGEIAVIAMADTIQAIEIPKAVETTVDLDFSSGAMEVNPEAEELFEKVNIPVPANLIPDNIAEGVNIAGIIGTFAASGGAKIASGKITTGGGPITVTHGLGVVPDIIVVGVPSATAGKSALSFAFGISQAFCTSLGINNIGKYTSMSSTNAPQVNNGRYIENTTEYGGVHNATENQFKVGNSTCPLSTSIYSYFWIAIGGLT